MNSNIETINYTLQKSVKDDISEKISRWLRPSDPSTNYRRALQKRQDDTGNWFLKGEILQAWVDGRNHFLWLHGLAGCGKTVLFTSVIKDIMTSEPARPRRVVLFHYFDFSDTGKQSFEDMLRSLLNQLYFRKESCQGLLEALFARCDNGKTQPDTDSLCSVFTEMARQAGTVHVAIDALDECPKEARLEVLTWMKTLMRSESSSLKLLMTSRREQEIESEVLKLANRKHFVPIQDKLVNQDILLYIRQRVLCDESLQRWQNNSRAQEEIERGLMKNPGGM